MIGRRKEVIGLDETRIREIAREEALKVLQEREAAAATTATGWGFKPFRAGGDSKPSGMERRRGEAGYFPVEKA